MIGLKFDSIFGPVISFGSGGTKVEIMRDNAVALPPLNSMLAEKLISRTKVKQLLAEFGNMPAANMDAIVNVLLRVSAMACELPWIKEMDINPLIADEHVSGGDAYLALAAVTVVICQCANVLNGLLNQIYFFNNCLT